MAPELGAGTRGARVDDPSPAFDPWVTGGSGETNPDTRERARRLVSSEADAMTGLESKASRARARRQWRTAAAAFRQWRQRGRVAAGARRALATVGKHRAFDRTTAVAAIASWRCLTTRERRAKNDADAARVAVQADAVSLRERAVEATVEELVAGRLRDAAREIEAARASEEETTRRAHMRVRAAELERDAHCEDAERERRRADAAEAEGVAMCRRVTESLAEEARRALSVAAADAAAEREWLRVALEKAWAEVLARRRVAGAKDADASLHEHLATVAGEAWADELAKALVPPAAHGGPAPMLAPALANGAAALPRTDGGKKKASPSTKTQKVSTQYISRGLCPPKSVGRVVGVPRRDFAPQNVSTPPKTNASARALRAPAWRAPSAADPSPLAAEERRDRDAARERARVRREGRFGDSGHSTRAKSSPWTPRSLSVSSRAASLLGLETEPLELLKTVSDALPVEATTSERRTGRIGLPSSPSGGGSRVDQTNVFANRASPTRATLARKDRLADEAWETSRARFALSREAFGAAVEHRLREADREGEANSDGAADGDAARTRADAADAPYSVQTPGGSVRPGGGGTSNRPSRLGVASAEGGALALAAAAARRFALPGDTDTDSDGGSGDSDDHEWLFREEKEEKSSTLR